MDTVTAVGLLAAPGIVASVVAILRPLLERWLTSDAIPPLAVALGIAYVVAAWQGGVVEAENGVVAALLGLTVGLGATGAREITAHYRDRAPT